MAEYKVEVDLSDLFDDMTINEQKNFLVEKFSSLPINKMVEVAGEILDNLNGDQVAKVIEDAFDNLHEQGQEQVNIFHLSDWIFIDELFDLITKGGE